MCSIMSGVQLTAVFFITTITGCFGHICLVTPHQRGILNISTSGNPSCFRHGPPCGGPAAEDPKVTLMAGSNAFIKWQQNYNHYSVGYPGYMDLAIASSPSSSFQLLAVTSDKYEYKQDSQVNHTVVVTLPADMECDHCVLRVRYNAHKPGESTFYQCADVRVTKTEGGQLRHQLPTKEPEHRTLLKAMRLVLSQKRHPLNAGGQTMLYGLMFNPNEPDTVDYVVVNAVTGINTKMTTLDFGVGFSSKPFQTFNQNYIADGVVVLDLPQGVTLMMNHAMTLDLDKPASTMLAIGTTNGTVIRSTDIFQFKGKVISAIVFESFQLYQAFVIEESQQKPGTYFFVVGHLDWSGMWREIVRTPTAEDTFVNFQWAEYDPMRQLLFVLMGNENDPDGLSARIYTFDIANSAFMSAVDLDVSRFTFMSMQLYRKTGQLLAVSPGLFQTTYPAYSLVEVNPFQGTVTEIAKITQPGIFERYYGGTVFNGVDQERGLLTYVFRVADAEADVIATINLSNMKTTFSELTNIRHVHNLVRGL